MPRGPAENYDENPYANQLIRYAYLPIHMYVYARIGGSEIE